MTTCDEGGMSARHGGSRDGRGKQLSCQELALNESRNLLTKAPGAWRARDAG